MKWIIPFLVINLFVTCQDKDDFKKKEFILSNEKVGTATKIPEGEKVVILPRYEILDKIQMISGKTFADILIPNFTTTMDKDSLSKIAFAILKKERLDEAEFYVTKDAYKSNYSSSFANKNPNAVKEGYLGGISGNVFRP